MKKGAIHTRNYEESKAFEEGVRRHVAQGESATLTR